MMAKFIMSETMQPRRISSFGPTAGGTISDAYYQA
jgi:hypothetical protein